MRHPAASPLYDCARRAKLAALFGSAAVVATVALVSTAGGGGDAGAPIEPLQQGMANRSCGGSAANGERFRFTRSDGKPVAPTCANGTAFWDVGADGTCAPVDTSGQGSFTTTYMVIGIAALLWGGFVYMRGLMAFFGGIYRPAQGRDSQTERDAARQKQLLESMSDEQKAAVFGTPPPADKLVGCRAKLSSPNMQWTWFGVAMVVSNL